MWADIDVKGDKVRVFNVHLETTGINGTQHRIRGMQAKGYEIDDSQIMKTIFGKYMLGIMFRSTQANLIADEVRSSDQPVILCGDFNDVPYSYVYNTMLGNMVDGFKECGSGFAQTYRLGHKPVRIDYIFHDEALHGLSYYNTDLTYSDHYPVFMKLSLK
jgi:endonuclease/exonuclease/phosphatase family metal-dependent hydrolase